MSAEEIVNRALAYPFDLPKDSYLLVGGRVYPLIEFSMSPLGDTLLNVDGKTLPLRRIDRSATALGARHYIPILASGSNAAPDRLRHKFARHLESSIIPVVRSPVLDICSVYSAHFAPYGSIPATLHWLEGARTDLFCVFVPAYLLDDLHTTESLGVNYGFFEIRSPRILLTGCETQTFYAYISLRGNLGIEGRLIRLPVFPYEGPHLEALSEALVFQRIVPAICPGMQVRDFVQRIIQDEKFRHEQSEVIRLRFSKSNESAHFLRLE